MQAMPRAGKTQDSTTIVLKKIQILRFIRSASLFAFALCPIVCFAAPPADVAPNIVFITIDTVRADHLGCYGYKLIETPHLDALATSGVRFANAYTPVPITLPAHSVMLTGTYPMRTGMHDFSGNRLNSSQPTLATLLRAHGYATGAAVGSAVLDSRFGLSRGFDFYYDRFDFSRLDERNIDAMMRPGNEVVDHALAWLDGNHRKPFLLWVHLYDAHHPYNPPASYLQKYRAHPYDGGIAFVDAQVGRVVAYLKSKGIYDRTLIVVAGDHGEGLGEHGEKTHGFFIYDATLHVPLIFKLPSGVAQRKPVVDEPANLADLLPTILELTGANRPNELEGRSLVPAIEGKTVAPPVDNYAETYLPRIHFNWSELRGVRFRQYHFIDAPRPELYDLSSDPHELTNLYTVKPAISNAMRKRLVQFIARYTRSAGEKTSESTGLDPALVERLKSLGYVAVAGGSDEVLSDHRLPDPKDRIQVYELVSDALSDSQRGRYDESIAKLLQAEKFEKDSLPVHYLLALNHYRQKDFTAAIGEFQTALKLSPSYSLASYFLGLSCVGNEDWVQAIAAFQQTLSLDATNFSAAYNLGAAYLKLGKVEDAEATFRQAVKINPNYAQAYTALGDLLLYQGKLGDAIAALRTALSIEPGNTRARQALIKALQANGQNNEAEEEMRKSGGGSPQP
ncbi:MAG TPA: sulfatase-like hydrolase/transferase [Candidatus Acidoferrum sp.]|nr:sulfatase-like hydrolase/transferase [Candidatus Acidoferrum sp.]